MSALPYVSFFSLQEIEALTLAGLI